MGGTAADQADIISVNDSDFLHVYCGCRGYFAGQHPLIAQYISAVYMIVTVLFNFGRLWVLPPGCLSMFWGQAHLIICCRYLFCDPGGGRFGL